MDCCAALEQKKHGMTVVGLKERLRVDRQYERGKSKGFAACGRVVAPIHFLVTGIEHQHVMPVPSLAVPVGRQSCRTW